MTGRNVFQGDTFYIYTLNTFQSLYYIIFTQVFFTQVPVPLLEQSLCRFANSGWMMGLSVDPRNQIQECVLISLTV